VFAIKIPEREFGAKRMSLRKEARDRDGRCQFRKTNFKDDDCDYWLAGCGSLPDPPGKIQF
jgi:hypothetical protein